MEQLSDFDFYLKFTRPLILNLPENDDRILAAAWVQKLLKDTTGSEKVRLDHLKLLLFVLQRKKLAPPFTQHPNALESLEDFPQNLTLIDVAKNIVEKENADRRERFVKLLMGEGDFPPFISDFSGDLLEYAAVQTITDFGVHAYYAVSKFPLNSWYRTDKQLFPKAAKIMLEVSTPPPTFAESQSSPELVELSPEKSTPPPPAEPQVEPPAPEEPPPEAEAEPKPEPPKEEAKKKEPRKSTLGASPPSRPIGKLFPPLDEWEPPTWGSNLLEAKLLDEEIEPPTVPPKKVEKKLPPTVRQTRASQLIKQRREAELAPPPPPPKPRKIVRGPPPVIKQTKSSQLIKQRREAELAPPTPTPRIRKVAKGPLLVIKQTKSSQLMQMKREAEMAPPPPPRQPRRLVRGPPPVIKQTKSSQLLQMKREAELAPPTPPSQTRRVVRGPPPVIRQTKSSQLLKIKKEAELALPPPPGPPEPRKAMGGPFPEFKPTRASQLLQQMKEAKLAPPLPPRPRQPRKVVRGPPPEIKPTRASELLQQMKEAGLAAPPPPTPRRSRKVVKGPPPEIKPTRASQLLQQKKEAELTPPPPPRPRQPGIVVEGPPPEIKKTRASQLLEMKKEADRTPPQTPSPGIRRVIPSFETMFPEVDIERLTEIAEDYDITEDFFWSELDDDEVSMSPAEVKQQLEDIGRSYKNHLDSLPASTGVPVTTPRRTATPQRSPEARGGPVADLRKLIMVRSLMEKFRQLRKSVKKPLSEIKPTRASQLLQQKKQAELAPPPLLPQPREVVKKPFPKMRHTKSSQLIKQKREAELAPPPIPSQPREVVKKPFPKMRHTKSSQLIKQKREAELAPPPPPPQPRQVVKKPFPKMRHTKSSQLIKQKREEELAPPPPPPQPRQVVKKPFPKMRHTKSSQLIKQKREAELAPPPPPPQLRKVVRSPLPEIKPTRASQLLQQMKEAGLAPPPPPRPRQPRKVRRGPPPEITPTRASQLLQQMKEAERARRLPLPRRPSKGKVAKKPSKGKLPPAPALDDEVQQFLTEFNSVLGDIEEQRQIDSGSLQPGEEALPPDEVRVVEEPKPKRQLSRLAKMLKPKISKAHGAAVELDKSIHVSSEAREIFEAIIEGPSTSSGIAKHRQSRLRAPKPLLKQRPKKEEQVQKIYEQEEEESSAAEDLAQMEAPHGHVGKDSRLVTMMNEMIQRANEERIERNRLRDLMPTEDYDLDDFEATERQIEEEMRRAGQDPHARLELPISQKQYGEMAEEANEEYDLDDFEAVERQIEEEMRRAGQDPHARRELQIDQKQYEEMEEEFEQAERYARAQWNELGQIEDEGYGNQYYLNLAELTPKLPQPNVDHIKKWIYAPRFFRKIDRVAKKMHRLGLINEFNWDKYVAEDNLPESGDEDSTLSSLEPEYEFSSIDSMVDDEPDYGELTFQRSASPGSPRASASPRSGEKYRKSEFKTETDEEGRTVTTSITEEVRPEDGFEFHSEERIETSPSGHMISTEERVSPRGRSPRSLEATVLEVVPVDSAQRAEERDATPEQLDEELEDSDWGSLSPMTEEERLEWEQRQQYPEDFPEASPSPKERASPLRERSFMEELKDHEWIGPRYKRPEILKQIKLHALRPTKEQSMHEDYPELFEDDYVVWSPEVADYYEESAEESDWGSLSPIREDERLEWEQQQQYAEEAPIGPYSPSVVILEDEDFIQVSLSTPNEVERTKEILEIPSKMTLSEIDFEKMKDEPLLLDYAQDIPEKSYDIEYVEKDSFEFMSPSQVKQELDDIELFDEDSFEDSFEDYFESSPAYTGVPATTPRRTPKFRPRLPLLPESSPIFEEETTMLPNLEDVEAMYSPEHFQYKIESPEIQYEELKPTSNIDVADISPAREAWFDELQQIHGWLWGTQAEMKPEVFDLPGGRMHAESPPGLRSPVSPVVSPPRDLKFLADPQYAANLPTYSQDVAGKLVQHRRKGTVPDWVDYIGEATYEPPPNLTPYDIELQKKLGRMERLKKMRRICFPKRSMRVVVRKSPAPSVERVQEAYESPRRTQPDIFDLPPLGESMYEEAPPEELFAGVPMTAEEYERRARVMAAKQFPKKLYAPVARQPELSPIGSPVDYPELSPVTRRPAPPSPAGRRGPQRRSVRKKLRKKAIDFSTAPRSPDELLLELIDVETEVLDDEERDLATPSPPDAYLKPIQIFSPNYMRNLLEISSPRTPPRRVPIRDDLYDGTQVSVLTVTPERPTSPPGATRPSLPFSFATPVPTGVRPSPPRSFKPATPPAPRHPPPSAGLFQQVTPPVLNVRVLDVVSTVSPLLESERQALMQVDSPGFEWGGRSPTGPADWENFKWPTPRIFDFPGYQE